MTGNDIVVYCEHQKNGLTPITTEALGIGRKLADETESKLIGIVLGENTVEIAPEAVKFGADQVFTVGLPELSNYQTDTFLAVFELLNRRLSPSVILMGQTGIGRDLAPALAAHLESSATLDCVELALDDQSKRLLMTKPVYGGNAWAVYTTDCNPQIATIRAKAMEPLEPDGNRTGDIQPLDVEINDDAIRVKMIKNVPDKTEGIRLEDARVVIGGGRGVGSAESFGKLEEIATLLNGTVGASRAACDNGWIPATKQIGLTGRVVTPDLYFAVGVSGASQHMAGCHGSSHIIAINNDDGAHIFNEANFGVIGDWKVVMDGFVNKLNELGPA